MTRRAIIRALGRLRRGARVRVSVNGEPAYRATFGSRVGDLVAFVPRRCRLPRHVSVRAITSIEEGWGDVPAGGRPVVH